MISICAMTAVTSVISDDPHDCSKSSGQRVKPVRAADWSLYQVKNGSKGTFVVYTSATPSV